MAKRYIKDQVGVWNCERWSDLEFDELRQASVVETDEQQPHDIYIRFHDIMDNMGAYVWLTFPPTDIPYHDGVERVVTPSGVTWQIQNFEWIDGSS